MRGKDFIREGGDPQSAKEKIMKCISIEASCAEVYRAYAELFPEEREFWEALSREEENHARLYIAGEFFRFIGDSAGKLSLPPSVFIDRTLEYIDNIKKRLQLKSPLSPGEALEMALKVEESLAESYLFEIPEGGDAALMTFKKLLVDTRTHIDRIKELMIKKGYIKLA